MNIEVADTNVAIMAAAAATRKMAGLKAEPDPVPLLSREDIKTELPEKRYVTSQRSYLNNNLASSDKAEVVPGVRGDENFKVLKLERRATALPASTGPPTRLRGNVWSANTSLPLPTPNSPPRQHTPRFSNFSDS
jgi:hypothetical protein